MEQKEKGNDILIRVMVPEDYEQVYRLWCGIKGFGISGKSSAILVPLPPAIITVFIYIFLLSNHISDFCAVFVS